MLQLQKEYAEHEKEDRRRALASVGPKAIRCGEHEVRYMLRDRNRTVSVSPLVYTRQELEQRPAIQDFFIRKVLEKSEVLYG
jgi:hypothetical protein